MIKSCDFLVKISLFTPFFPSFNLSLNKKLIYDVNVDVLSHFISRNEICNIKSWKYPPWIQIPEINDFLDFFHVFTPKNTISQNWILLDFGSETSHDVLNKKPQKLFLCMFFSFICKFWLRGPGLYSRGSNEKISCAGDVGIFRETPE